MRTAVPTALAALLVLVLPAAHAEVFVPDAAVLVAHDDAEDPAHDEPTREELRERKRRLREEARDIKRDERELRERERHDDEHDHHPPRGRVHRHVMTPRFWLGLGAGAGFASVDVPCSFGSAEEECDESGSVGTYSANVTLTGPYTGLRLRGVRAQDKGNDSRTPYELAAMLGSRFGRSNWYGFLGAGRIQHADDEFEGDTHGFAWEVVFAPQSHTATGFELSFMGDTGRDVDFFAVNLGARFGLLR